jgi:hypothetical protein
MQMAHAEIEELPLMEHSFGGRQAARDDSFASIAAYGESVIAMPR